MPETPATPEMIESEINAQLDEILIEMQPVTETLDKVEIIVNGVEIGYNLNLAYNAIVADNNPPTIYQRAGKLVRTIDVKNTTQIDEFTPDSFREVIDGICAFKTLKMVRHNSWTGENQSEEIRLTPTYPPIDLLRSLLVRPNFNGIPELQSITDCPIMNSDGSISFESGYNIETKTYYRPQIGLNIPDIPEHPTDSDIIAASNLLSEAICDFPFVPGASKTNLIGTIITSVIRPMIDGCVPICLIDKPQAGTGASLLSETIALISTGAGAVVRVAPEDDAAWRKLITSILNEGKLISLIDNVEDKVDLPSLAGAVTSRVWSDRLLGQSKTITFDHRLLWILNGNNVRLGGDLPRRCIWVRMNANVERPWLRPGVCFKHNQIPWIEEHRGDILSAIYTIVRGWIQAGKPEPSILTPMMGGFEEWRNVIGGILQFVGYTDFLKNNEEMLDEVDDDAPDWSFFFKTLFDRFNAEHVSQIKFGEKKQLDSVTFTVVDIVTILEKEIDTNNCFMGISKIQDAMPAELNDAYISKRNFNTYLGRKIVGMKDRLFACGLKLTKSESKEHNKVKWVLTKL